MLFSRHNLFPFSKNKKQWQVLMESQSITDKIQDNPTAKIWYRKNRKLMAWLVAVSGGIYPVASVCSSRMFGLNKLDFGLSTAELASFETYKLKYTVMLENFPQLVLQVFFLSMDFSENSQSFGTWLALTSSTLSIFSTVLSYCMGQSLAGSAGSQRSLVHMEPAVASKEHDPRDNDYKRFQRNKFMLRKLHSNCTKGLSVGSHEIEVVSVIVRPSHTTIVLDYFGELNFDEKLKSHSEDLNARFCEIFHLKEKYTLHFEASTAQWELEKKKFWQKFIAMQNAKAAEGGAGAGANQSNVALLASGLEDSTSFDFGDSLRVSGVTINFNAQGTAGKAGTTKGGTRGETKTHMEDLLSNEEEEVEVAEGLEEKEKENEKDPVQLEMATIPPKEGGKDENLEGDDALPTNASAETKTVMKDGEDEEDHVEMEEEIVYKE